MNRGHFGFPSGANLSLVRVQHFTSSGTFLPALGTLWLLVEVASATNSNNWQRRTVGTVTARQARRDPTVTVGTSAGAASSFAGISSGSAGGTGGAAGWVTIYEFGPA